MNHWQGKFRSQTYSVLTFSMVHGSLDLFIDKNDENGTFTLIYEGIYKNEQESKGTLHKNASDIVGKFGNGTITFTIGERTENEINGSYQLDTPYDSGVFHLTRSNHSSS